MWVVAGILLGLVLLAALVGFHSGPHVHAAAGAIGVVAAGWLVLMAVEGHSAPALWALVSADVVVSAGVGTLAWLGLTRPGVTPLRSTGGIRLRLEGAEGVAVSTLAPEGVVRVRGEQWSAASVNGTVRAGTRVQVLRAAGVRLDVWGEEVDDDPGAGVGPGKSEEADP